MSKECNGCTEGCSQDDNGFGAVIGAILDHVAEADNAPDYLAHNALELQMMSDAIRFELDESPVYLKIVGAAVSLIVEDSTGNRSVVELESEDGVFDAISASAEAEGIAEEVLDAASDVLQAVGSGR